MSIIEIKNLSEIYDGSQVEVRTVDGINLSFDKGEFTAIVGPTGSGKTTFLNLLGGLDHSTSREVVVDGVIIWKLSPGKLIDFLFSTHDPRVVRKARRIITLEDGKVLTDEPAIK